MDLAPVTPADPLVIKVGRFAVEEYNKRHGTKLSFVSVFDGFSGHVVGFKIYIIIIEIQDGKGDPRQNRALVLENPDRSFSLSNYWE